MPTTVWQILNISNTWNDRKRKLGEFAETCLENFMKSFSGELSFWRIQAIWNHCELEAGRMGNYRIKLPWAFTCCYVSKGQNKTNRLEKSAAN